MKAKNILMTLLLVTGAIAAKASGYPPELALVSQPVMVYNHSSITVYYDVENIGDYTYRGDVYIYLDPDYGYYYAKKWVKVYPGRIKRIAVDIPIYNIDLHRTFTIMPYYEVGRDLYSFTTFEYFEPVRFYWHGPRTEPWVVIHVGPRPRYYHRPGTYRYYYDGYRPPMPGRGPGMPPPMNPMHHTYGYHHSIGGYPATHPEWSNNEMPKPSNEVAPSATVKPNGNTGSMSSGSGNASSAGSMSSGNGNTSSTRPSANSRPEGTGNNSSSVSRPSGNASRPGTSSSVGSSSSSRPSSNGSVSRPSSNNTRPSGNSVSGSSSRPSNSSSTRTGSSSSSSRNSGNSSSSRASSSSSNTRSSGTSSGSTRSSSTSSNSRSGASTGSATSSGRR